MATGTVSWFDPQTGTGIIVCDDGTEVVVRRDQIDGGGFQSLRTSDRVAFALREEGDGYEAMGVYLP
ncbi:cold-shock protein [Pseudonocardia pini]|uniref:cold-shock protein n=1 Tax=Pseudonocardia pini TaxID=2758030 RepID=UPI0015F0E5BE|nr:cold shock domain-containing protein [Pseudonocardia pini]